MPVMPVPSALDTSLVISDLKHRRRESALAEMVTRAAEAGAVRSPSAVLDLIAARETLVGSALGRSTALAAVRSLAVTEARLVVGRSRRGISWGAADEEPVRLVALLLSPADRALPHHLDSIVRIAALLRHARGRDRLLHAESPDDFAVRVREALS